MSATAVSPRPQWIEPGDRFGLTPGVSSADPSLVFDWSYLGVHNSALRFVMINTGLNPLLVTPEAAYKSVGPAEAGPQAPAPFTVAPGACYGDPYGIDEMRPYWRLWVSGDTTFEWGVQGIPR